MRWFHRRRTFITALPMFAVYLFPDRSPNIKEPVPRNEKADAIEKARADFAALEVTVDGKRMHHDGLVYKAEQEAELARPSDENDDEAAEEAWHQYG